MSLEDRPAVSPEQKVGFYAVEDSDADINFKMLGTFACSVGVSLSVIHAHCAAL